MSDAEALCRGFLQNATARQTIVARVAPEDPSADYLAGFSAGREAGEVAGLALALSILSGESPTALIADAQGQAAMDVTFPFELHVDFTSEELAS
jgi:hypothetical protein